MCWNKFWPPPKKLSHKPLFRPILTGAYAARRTHVPSPLCLISVDFSHFVSRILSPNLETPQFNRENSPNYPRETIAFGVTWCHKACPTHNSPSHPPLAPDHSSTSPEGSAPLKWWSGMIVYIIAITNIIIIIIIIIQWNSNLCSITWCQGGPPSTKALRPEKI